MAVNPRLTRNKIRNVRNVIEQERRPLPTVMPTRSGGGEPGSGFSRKAITTAAASGTTVTVNLYDATDTEITTGPESNITVNFYFVQVDSAVAAPTVFSATTAPVIDEDLDIPVEKYPDGEWYCPWWIMDTKDCV